MQKKLFCKENLHYFLLLNLGLVLTALGVHLFKTPNHFAIGGTSGLSIIGATLFPQLQVGDMMFVINAALILLGLAFLGRKAMGVTIYSSLALSAFVRLLEVVFPMSGPFTNETMLELLFAVILPAAGSAIVFNIGASTGGTDIVAMILSKYTSLEIGKALLVSDFFIAAAAIFIYDVRTGLFCILGLLMKAFLVDGVIESINTRKMITIVSQHSDEIAPFIMGELHRSATVYAAEGAYSHRPVKVLTTILSRREAMQLRNFIRRTDPEAFLSIVNSSETIGKGFRHI